MFVQENTQLASPRQSDSAKTNPIRRRNNTSHVFSLQVRYRTLPIHLAIVAISPAHPYAYLNDIETQFCPCHRLVRHALELKKPVLLLNVGPTRADGVPGVEKIEMSSRDVMRDAVRAAL